MIEDKKLPRIPIIKKYITGDSQEWTYEYTWEDYKVSKEEYPNCPPENSSTGFVYYNPNIDYDIHIGLLINQIKEYFIQYPEKMLKNCYLEESGVTPEMIRNHLTGKLGINLIRFMQKGEKIGSSIIL